MVSTPNYQFLQPDPNDFVNVITQLNDNFAKVDQDMNRFDWNIFTASGTWTKPARCKRVEVIVVGGGSSGGGCGATAGGQSSSGTGGAGGGWSRKLFLATSLSATETVDVGAGGAASAAGANPGNAGGTSKFATGKAYEVSATGGGAGVGGGASAVYLIIDGPFGGTGAGGDINGTGGDGGPSSVLNGLSVPTCIGGDSLLAGITMPLTASGRAGKAYGGGSSGAINYGSGGVVKASLAGAPGIVIVRNYY